MLKAVPASNKNITFTPSIPNINNKIYGRTLTMLSIPILSKFAFPVAFENIGNIYSNAHNIAGIATILKLHIILSFISTF